MAKNDVQIVITAHDLATESLKKVKESIEGVGNSASLSAGGITAMGAAVVVAAAAMAALAVSKTMDFMKESIAAAAESEDAHVKLAQALGRSSNALDEQATALQRSTIYEDDAVTAAQASLAMYTKSEAQIKALTGATVDFAAAKGMDLTSAADLVAKSLGGEMNALSRYGIEAGGAAGSTERLTAIMEGLEGHFGGQASAQANTFSGHVIRMAHSFGDLKEEIGGVITRSPVVIKAMDMLRDIFVRLGNAVSGNQVFLMELVQGGIVTFLRAMGFAIDIVGSFVLAWDYLKVIVNGITYGMAATLEAVLSPFKAIWEWLQKITNAKGGPDIFGELFAGVTGYKEIAHGAMTTSMADIDKTIAKFGMLHSGIQDTADALAAIKSTPTNISAATTANKPSNKSTSAVVDIKYDLSAADAYYKSLKALDEANLADKSIILSDEQAIQDTAWNAKLMGLQANHASIQAIEMEHTAFLNNENTKRILDDRKVSDMKISSMQSTAQNFSNALKTMSTLGHAESRKYFDMYKAAAISEAIISTYKGANAALGMGPWGIPLAASIIAAGLANVVAIEQQDFNRGGGGGGSAASGATGSYPANPATGLPTPNTNKDATAGPTQIFITVNSPMVDANWQEVVENHITPALNANGSRGVQLNRNVLAPA